MRDLILDGVLGYSDFCLFVSGYWDLSLRLVVFWLCWVGREEGFKVYGGNRGLRRRGFVCV